LITLLINAGYTLKKQQIEALTVIDFDSLYREFKTDPIKVKRILKLTPTIGRATYKNLVKPTLSI